MTEDSAPPTHRGGNAVTIWELEVGKLPVYYFRMEGQPLSLKDREGMFQFYRETIATQRTFATLYDFSLGLPGFMSHIGPLASFCNGMRPVTKGKLQFMVAVCPDALYRGFLSLLLNSAPSHAPMYLVGTLEEAWAVLARSGDGDVPWNPASEPPSATAASFASVPL